MLIRLPNRKYTTPEEVHIAENQKKTKGGGQNKKLDPAIREFPTPPFRLYKERCYQFQPRGSNLFAIIGTGCHNRLRTGHSMYIYRERPVLLYVEKDPEGKQKDFEFNYIDKISGAEPLQDEADCIKPVRVWELQTGVSMSLKPGKPNRTLCTVYATEHRRRGLQIQPAY